MIIDLLKNKTLRKMACISACILAAGMASASEETGQEEEMTQEETQKTSKGLRSKMARKAKAAQKKVSGAVKDATEDLDEKLRKPVNAIRKGGDLVNKRAQAMRKKLDQQICVFNVNRLKYNAQQLSNVSAKFTEASINVKALARQTQSMVSKMQEKCPNGDLCNAIKKINDTNTQRYDELSQKFTSLSEEARQSAEAAHDQVSELEEECNLGTGAMPVVDTNED